MEGLQDGVGGGMLSMALLHTVPALAAESQ